VEQIQKMTKAKKESQERAKKWIIWRVESTQNFVVLGVFVFILTFQFRQCYRTTLIYTFLPRLLHSKHK
jgi:hypothetical protein